MRNLLHPLWLLFVSIIPIAVFASICFGNFVVIESLLSDYQVSLWISFGINLGILWIAHLLYSVILLYNRKQLSVVYAVLALLTYIPFLYLFYTYSNDLIPWSIPAWMVPENIFTYAGTFIMPTLAHAMSILIVTFTKNVENKKPGINFLIAIICPVAWYLFIMLLLPLWQNFDRIIFSTHVLVILVITGTVIFLFFLGRGIYIVASRRKGLFERHQWPWLIVVGIVFPVVGLAINAKESNNGVFGDFSSPWFYVLAVINGVAVATPDLENKTHRLLLFAVRSITFTFILYFFLVFLPYLPLSIVAIVAIGTGFLMLTPLVLMIIQTRKMYTDIAFLSNFYAKKIICSVLLAGVLVLPLAITWEYLKDKQTLTSALDHAYNFSLEEETRIDIPSLKNVLQKIRDSKERRWGLEDQTPFLSTYYNWLVLDNLTLSYDKTQWLEKVFTGSSDDLFQNASTQTSEPAPASSITNITAHSTYDPEQQAWKSNVELEITNAGIWQSEFVSSFKLPEGSWISDYYLWIGDKKEKGILAEKKTATWVYQQITTARRDPGILYYLNKNRIALRVFPMEPQQTRKTGFEIFHKEPFHFTIDDRPVFLGNPGLGFKPAVHEAGKAIYISVQAKRDLPVIHRTPVYHFIVNCSEGRARQADEHMTRIAEFAQSRNIDLNTSHFHFTNAYVTSANGWTEANSALETLDFTGGFFLDRSLEKILMQSYLKRSNEYPVIVVVTSALSNALRKKDFSDLQLTFPESDFFYELNDHPLELIPHSLLLNPEEPATITRTPKEYAVAAWPDKKNPKAFLRVDDQPSIFLNETETTPSSTDFHQHTWPTALALHGEWLAHTLHPDRSDEAWRTLVRNSFEARIMTPVTSFISLENEAQRKALLRKQNEILNGKASLDAGEETRMSEPGMVVLILAVALFLLRKQMLILPRYFNKI